MFDEILTLLRQLRAPQMQYWKMYDWKLTETDWHRKYRAV